MRRGYRKRRGTGYVLAHGVMLAAFGLAWCADRFLSVANLSLILLTAVLIVAARTRMSVAFYTATLAFVGDNFLFTAPRYSLAIAHADDAITISLFFVAALVASRLATRLANQVQALRMADAHAQVSLALGRRLAAATEAGEVRQAGVEMLAQVLGGAVAVLGAAGQGRAVLASSPSGVDLTGLALDTLACHPLAEAAAGADRLSRGARDGWWLLMLDTGDQAAEVVALQLDPAQPPLSPELRGTVLAMVQAMSQALHRACLAQVLQDVRLQGETERLRTALLSSVSHDLRSPLASMVGSAETLLHFDAQLGAHEREALLAAILGEGQRLDRYIQNLLDMTRLEYGALQLQLDWHDLAEIIANACRRLRILFPSLPVELDLPQDTLLLHVHAALIEQALFNVLENAARFSPPEGRIRVVIRLDETWLSIEIHDQGPGIPEEERMQVFDMFYSVARGDRGGVGTGLGLAICRGMMVAHGGQVEALAGLGGGLIRLLLPRSAVMASTADGG